MSRAYVDANVLVYALHPRDHPKKQAARRLLREHGARGQTVTCALTLDELVWALRKELDRTTAIAVGRTALGMPSLAIEPVGFLEMDRALTLAQDQGLDPRDAIHAAVAYQTGCTAILSDDPDFDRIPDLPRVGLP
jgi:predicted nucleic acid-binding protein